MSEQSAERAYIEDPFGLVEARRGGKDFLLRMDRRLSGEQLVMVFEYYWMRAGRSDDLCVLASALKFMSENMLDRVEDDSLRQCHYRLNDELERHDVSRGDTAPESQQTLRETIVDIVDLRIIDGPGMVLPAPLSATDFNDRIQGI